MRWQDLRQVRARSSSQSRGRCHGRPDANPENSVSGTEDLKRLGGIRIGKGHLRRVGKLKVGKGFSDRLSDVLAEAAADNKSGAQMSADVAMAVVETSHEAFVGMDGE